MLVWGDFKHVTEETGGGRGVKNFRKWGDVFYGWSLIHYKFPRPSSHYLRLSCEHFGDMFSILFAVSQLNLL